MKHTESLKKNFQFRYVYNKGKSLANRHLVMYVVKTGKQINHIGISVSKQVGKSVVRSRVTRLIRESYRLQKKELEQGYNLVFLWNKNQVKDRKCQEVQADMRQVFQKAGIIK